MITVESLKNIDSITKRIIKIKFSGIPEYLERISQTYEFNMENDWQVRREINNKRDKEFPVRYIEYIISRGGEYKTFYINLNRETNRVDLIDGRRRILAIREYLGDRLAVFRGHYYREFGETDRKRLDEEIEFEIKISELKSKVEILSYYNGLNFYRENEISNNMIFLEKLPITIEEENSSVIEIGTGRELKYWEYNGNVLNSLPVPTWVRNYLIRTGRILYRDNHWIDENSKREIEIGIYLFDDKLNKFVRVVRDRELFHQYYFIKE